MTLARACRWGAILIAIVGVVDPSMTLARSARPTVSVIDSGSAAAADRVARALAADATVVRGLLPDASAVVVVGHQLPAFARDVSTPAFVVKPDGPAVEIERVIGPSRSSLDARASFVAAVHATGARGQTVSVALAANGIALDRQDRAIAGDDVRVDVPLTFVPSEVGAARIRVTATLSGAPSMTAASADALIHVDRTTWAIFAFDRRPSWMSTFVRRALEDDNRFAVTSRTVTSRAVATNTPDAPQDFENASSLDRFDAIVVGAPDALTTGDVANLEAYLTRRAGAIILLWDVRPAGPALRLTGVEGWHFDTQATDRAVTALAGTMRASDLAWPTQLPASAEVIGRADALPAGGADPSHTLPIVWRADRGPGRIVVSGALDGWRYRDAPQAAFDSVWRRIVADAAAASPPPLTVGVTPAVARPGESLTVHASIRDAELATIANTSASSIHTTIAVTLTNPSTGEIRTLRAWPDGAPGRFVATAEAPAQSGAYEIIAAGDGAKATADLLVDPTALHAVAGEGDALGAWARSRGGRVISETALSDLNEAIRQLPTPRPSPAHTHPMRSAWWIAPMTLLLSAEWLTRRRQGLA